MERFIGDDSQRPGKLIIDRPIVCGDIHDIPFINDAFSFIHCSHILEHLYDPAKAIAEMMRVSRSGYIETPSEIHEFLDLNFPFHRWAISAEDDKLIFREKTKNIATHPLIEALKDKKNRTTQFIRKHHDEINIISLFWQDEVNFRIERSDHAIENYMTEDTSSSAKGYAVSSRKSKLKLMLGKLLSPTINLHEILACPICKHHIQIAKPGLICTNCNKKFPIINDIPMMIKEYASSF